MFTIREIQYPRSGHPCTGHRHIDAVPSPVLPAAAATAAAKNAGDSHYLGMPAHGQKLN
jgi:hypothetical protein